MNPVATRKTVFVSVVVPVHNGSEALEELVSRVRVTLMQIGARFEVILVNDGSRDDSWPRIQTLARQFDFVRGIDLLRNYGQHNALLAGVREAKGEITVTLDDDLQHPPEEIPKLVAALDEAHDVVYGIPDVLRHSWWRNAASRLTKGVLERVFGIDGISSMFAFRAFDTRIRDAFAGYVGSSVDLDALLSWGSRDAARVVVRNETRQRGRSGYTFTGLVSQAIGSLANFSAGPLRLAAYAGMILMLAGGLPMLYATIRMLTGAAGFDEFPFLACAMVLLSGVQLVALGVIGEYLGRVHFMSMGKPSSVVRERVGFDHPVSGSTDSPLPPSSRAE